MRLKYLLVVITSFTLTCICTFVIWTGYFSPNIQIQIQIPPPLTPTDESYFTIISTGPQNVPPIVLSMYSVKQDFNKDWGGTQLCDVPREWKEIIDNICGYKCKEKMPCHLLNLIPPGSNTSSSTYYQINCGGTDQCFYTTNLEYLQNHTNIAFDLIHGNESRRLMQQFKSNNTVWVGGFSGESLAYYPEAAYIEDMDLTMGYDSAVYDVWSIPYLNEYFPFISSPKPFNITWLKERWNTSKPHSVFVASNCNPLSNRTGIVSSLMSYMSIDSFGKCLNTVPKFPPHVLAIEGTHSPGGSQYEGDWIGAKLALLADYPFTISIENSLVHDYVSEKLWQPFAAGSIPVYMGPPGDIDKFMPGDNSFIDMYSFPSLSALADHLNAVAANDTLLQSYHEWRTKPIRPSFLNLKWNVGNPYCMACKEHFRRKNM